MPYWSDFQYSFGVMLSRILLPECGLFARDWPGARAASPRHFAGWQPALHSAAPGPLFGPLCQACFHGVVEDIVGGDFVMALVADVTVVVLGHPQGAATAQQTVDFIGCVGTQRVHDV